MTTRHRVSFPGIPSRAAGRPGGLAVSCFSGRVLWHCESQRCAARRAAPVDPVRELLYFLFPSVRPRVSVTAGGPSSK
ncbi:hypothetical protein EYF80_005025 [Liparis tanakae]|uniref:Uncharacterized protein n=1 Tax=Liparis tanakae TaxID=230148 RepID=A0A4Z2J322_9TELE|nr:hypothetical protein EYF80_005025 [Liparis tanakae]